MDRELIWRGFQRKSKQRGCSVRPKGVAGIPMKGDVTKCVLSTKMGVLCIQSSTSTAQAMLNLPMGLLPMLSSFLRTVRQSAYDPSCRSLSHVWKQADYRGLDNGLQIIALCLKTNSLSINKRTINLQSGNVMSASYSNAKLALNLHNPWKILILQEICEWLTLWMLM